MYHVAHRYGMPTLSALALEHIMNTITPQTSFAMLLASSHWDDLRGLVEVSSPEHYGLSWANIILQDYIVEKWDEVSSSEEFERCCQEIAAGE
jgi:hypothetical protein